MTATTPSAITPPAVDRAGQVELLGYDHIPESERHGHPRELFSVWAPAMVAPLYLLLGGILMTLGMNLWQALLAMVVGYAAFALIGLQAVAGPRAGTPTITISRAQYGLRGNRLPSVAAWFNLVAFEALNFTVGATAVYALADQAGLSLSDPVKVIALGVVIAGTFVLAYYGHATIVAVQRAATSLLAVGTVLLFVFVLNDVDWSYTPETPLSGSAGLALWFVGLGVMVSGAISWCTMPADYSRYLPARTPARPIVLWTTVGCLVPALFLGLTAILAGTAVDMTDPIAALESVVPGWFYPVLLVVLLVGSISNNTLTVYSSAMSLQTLGLPIKRYQGVFVDGIIGSAMALYATFGTDFLTALTEFLQIMLCFYAPYTAIFLVDMGLRHSHYDGDDLHRSGGGRYWARSGWNPAGVIALAAGIVSAVLFASTTRIQGPLSKALSDIDLSYIVGFVVGGAVYWLLARRLIGVDQGAADLGLERVDTPERARV
jgi:NCS1 family nucleobase:cation symporter-1